MKACAENCQRELLLPAPGGKRREARVNPDLLPQCFFRSIKCCADASHLAGNSISQADIAFTDQPAHGLNHLRAPAKIGRQKDQRVLFSYRSVKVGENMCFIHLD